MNKEAAEAYWKENISTILKFLVVWFVVSYGCGIIFIDELNTITFGGFKLGFWFAQQGAMYVFVVLVFAYAKMMERIEEKYDVHE
jgi:putative solute:sodium symporter small subunit